MLRALPTRELYRFMSKGNTRLAKIAHEIRDERRGHPSTWRDRSAKWRAPVTDDPLTPPPASVSPTVLQAHILPDDSKA